MPQRGFFVRGFTSYLWNQVAARLSSHGRRREGVGPSFEG